MFFYTYSRKSRTKTHERTLGKSARSPIWLPYVSGNMDGESKRGIFSTPSCAFSWWQTVMDWAASACECDSVNAKQKKKKGAEKTYSVDLPCINKGFGVHPAYQTWIMKGQRMHGTQIAACLCSWHNAPQWHLLNRNKPALGTQSLPLPRSRAQRFVRAPRGKCWHCGLLLFLIIAAHISELSGASWWWHGEIGLTSFWRASPPPLLLCPDLKYERKATSHWAITQRRTRRNTDNCTLTRGSSSQCLDFKVCFKKGKTRHAVLFLFQLKVRGFLRERDLEQNPPVERTYLRLVEDWIN